MDKPKTSPRDFFLHFGGMVTLYISAISLISLWFAIINYALPNSIGGYYDPYSSGVAFGVASLIVIFPIFLIISRFLYRDEATHPEKRELGVRKWLIFLTLFVSGLVIAIDLITLLQRFFSGDEITAAFFAKVLVILIVVGGVFWYYIRTLRTAEGLSVPAAKRVFWAAALVVILSIVFGFLVMGTPFSQRERRIDAERINDLSNIQYAITSYWQAKQALPASLTDLNNPLQGFSVPADPETGALYEYAVTTAPYTFQLCATFSLAGGSEGTPVMYPGQQSDNWAHDAGHACFTRTIDPDLYPSLKVPAVM